MKRFSIFLAAVLISLTICPAVAQARSSENIMSYSVNALQGDESGNIDIDISLFATKSFPKIGVLKISLYEWNGDYVTTIWGDSSNGLLAPSSTYHFAKTYTYEGTPGTLYFAVVTLCAGTVSDYQTRTARTPMVRAPY